MLEWAIDVLEPAFRDWGLWLVFVATFLESAIVIASIVPGESVLLLGGFFASPGFDPGTPAPLDLPDVIVVAFAGALLGGIFGYLIGRVAGRSIVRRFGRFILLPERRLPILERYISYYGGRAILFGRFAPFLRSIRTLVAGIARMSVPRFLAAEVASAALWTSAIVAIGFGFGESWRVARRYLGAGGAVVFVLLAVAYVLTWRSVKRRFEREISESAAAAPVPPEAVPSDPPAEPPPSA